MAKDGWKPGGPDFRQLLSAIRADAPCAGTYTFTPVPAGSYVYFLYHGGRVVYVGQSKNLLARLGQHYQSRKRFDRVRFIRVQDRFLDAVELYFIRALRPKYNASKFCDCVACGAEIGPHDDGCPNCGRGRSSSPSAPLAGKAGAA